MIIGLSGYARSGKDTVGTMIQWLNCYDTQGITLQQVLDEYPHNDGWMSNQSGWYIKKYAAKLKQVAAILLGCKPHDFENIGIKHMNLGKEWGEMSVREFLQRLGTDGLRQGLHPDVWVNALWSDYRLGDNWVVTDVRFVNEAQRIKDMGGVIVRVNRPGYRAINQHISESALDNWPFDYTIENNENIEALLLNVIGLLKKLGVYEDNKAEH